MQISIWMHGIPKIFTGHSETEEASQYLRNWTAAKRVGKACGTWAVTNWAGTAAEEESALAWFYINSHKKNKKFLQLSTEKFKQFIFNFISEYLGCHQLST